MVDVNVPSSSVFCAELRISVTDARRIIEDLRSVCGPTEDAPSAPTHPTTTTAAANDSSDATSQAAAAAAPDTVAASQADHASPSTVYKPYGIVVDSTAADLLDVRLRFMHYCAL